jgi:hypothetical protein
MHRFSAFGLALALFGATAHAQIATPAVRQACAADMERICGSIPRGQR